MYNVLVDTFGQWVVREREKRGLSQNKLAQEMGYSQAALSRVESDKVEPSKELLKELARVLNVPFSEVMRHVGILPKESEKDEWLRRMEHKLSQIDNDEDRRLAEGLIDVISPDKKSASRRNAER